MPRPLLLEIHTRCWLKALSESLGHPVTLASVPDEQILSWSKRGFTHVWLMGVWATGDKTRDFARGQGYLQAESVEAFGPGGLENVGSSPYAVADYTVWQELGGEAELRDLRARLKAHGMGLILDFVPNHLGLDHPWLLEKNGLFVRSAGQRPETFPVPQANGTSWVAHGKDPYFPAWTDTAQLDYRQAATRAEMINALRSVAAQCDGVRCDMAMLLLNDIFDKTWAHFPSHVPAPPGEFWAEAISAVKKELPEFLFIAEAYWDTEPRLCALGFDYAYDKKFVDFLTRRDYPALQAHIRGGTEDRTLRFLENHDEPRIASVLSQREQKAAAVLLLAQPGLCLLHDGQGNGARRRTPVQFTRYWPEKTEPEISAFYERLLSVFPQAILNTGRMELQEAGAASCFAIKWRDDAGNVLLVLVNLAPQKASFHVGGFEPRAKVVELFSDELSNWSRQDGAIRIDLAECGFQLFQWHDQR